MQCPNCQFENRERAKFCSECGHKFEIICPECKATCRVGSKFCDECGYKFTVKPAVPTKDLSFDEKLNKIQRYLPRGLAEKILSQRDKIEGERRQVTVMFCDMEGFTPLVEQLGAEEAYAVMDQVYELLIHKVYDYEGTVNEMTGDGIMALFGAPIALEDAPQRAIRSAIAIHREIATLKEVLKGKSKRITDLKMRIGIHSGQVVVGTLGDSLRVEFKAVGDTVNLASRMETLAEPGAIYVTEDTFKLTEGFFRFEALGSKIIKGKKDPVKVYRVIAPSSRRTRFDVSAERGLTPFLGREREMELVLDGLQRVKEGMGQAFSIIGQAGVGKSRFLYEFRKIILNENITFLEGKCISYSKEVPYHSITDLLKGNFDIKDQDSDGNVRKKIIKGLKSLRIEESTTLPYILNLLGVKKSGIDRFSLSSEGIKEHFIETVKKIILQGAKIRPLVVAVEDLHWADKATEDALKYFVDSIPAARVLIIFTYRPDFLPKWGGRSYHNQITLNRLSKKESLTMVSDLLDKQFVDSYLQELILKKTEGVPFFIEEFVKSAKDLGVIKIENGRVSLSGDPQSLKIPATIQDMIMARVDSLPDDTRTVLQAGAVFEREFSHSLISAVTNIPNSKLRGHLSAIKEAELLYERGVYPNSSYIFCHALTRDVVYDSILNRKRSELHGQIGNAIEKIYKKDLSEYCEVLSEHFFHSGHYAKAAEYAKQAARKAEKNASLIDAVIQARKRIKYLEKLSNTDGWEKDLVDARTVLALYLNQLNRWIEAKEAVVPIIQMARNMGYSRRLGQIQNVMGAYYGFVEEDFPRAFDSLAEALRIAKTEKDYITQVMASLWSGVFYSFACEFEKVIAFIQHAVDINTAAKNLWGIASMKAQLAYFSHYYSGNINDLEKLSSEALDIAEQSGDPISGNMSHTTYGIACYAKGLLKKAEKHITKGKDLSERINFTGWNFNAWIGLAEINFEFKKYKKAKGCYLQALRDNESGHTFPSWGNWCRLGMARCDVMLGKKDLSLESLRNVHETIPYKVAQGWTCRYLGEIFLNLGGNHKMEAERWIKKAIVFDTKNGMRFHLGLDHALYGEFYKRQGLKNKSCREFGEATEILRKCGAVGWVEKYEKTMVEF